ncbi:MAG: proteasome accessory factor PafA2 family protein [Verrucomicrobiota bacterium]|jgi:proteasome accessory factor A
MPTSTSQAGSHNGESPRPRLPKLCGADFELGNLVLGIDLPKGTGALASHLLLREFDGLPLARKGQSICYCQACTARRRALEDGYTTAEFLGEECSMTKYGSAYNAQDWARKFLSNGGCAYIDLDHLELCIPEVLSARDHVAASHAMLRKARAALQMANARLPEGKKIVALANNSDGQGHSYGSHLNFLVTRRAWSDLFERRLQHLLFLAAYQASSIVFTGQGKIGAENNRPPVQYQISQRADFFEVLMGPQTTWNRPLINSRDEALCGPWYGASASPDSVEKARLHVIFYDQTLCHTASLLKVGVMQIILAMIEAGSVRTSIVLDDPVEAVWQWSHDPTLHCRVRLADGRNLTAVELQMLFWEEAQRFVASGGCTDIVPDAPHILELWSDTLGELRARDYAALARRLDWVLKLQILQRARQQRPNLTWASAELKHLDFMYGSLEDGLYWDLEKNGLVNALVTSEEIEHFRNEPPENTRAWTRARLLRLAEPQQIERVDWDSITFSLKGDHYWPRESTVNLTNPLGFTRTACQRVFQLSTTLEEASAMLSANQDGTAAISPTNAAVQEPIQIEGDHHESTRTPPA